MILYREVRKLAARKASLRGVLVPMLRKYAGRRSPKEQTTVEHLVETALKRPRTSGPNELDDVIYDSSMKSRTRSSGRTSMHG